MAITKNTGRQWPLVAEVSIAFGDTPTTATFYEAIDMPPTARVIGGGLTIDTAWATATSPTFSVGDSGSGTRYLTTKDLTSTAGTYFPFVIATDGGALDVGVTYAFTGSAADAGAATLSVLYVIDGKSNEVQPTADAA
jgi:hypothetical protein